MAEFRMVHTEFWSDPKVVEELTPEDKFFFLYLLTNYNTTQIGIYQITKKQIGYDMGYSPETVNVLLDRFIHKHKLIRYNFETRELAIKNWGRYNYRKGGKPVEDCVISELKKVKDVKLIEFVGELVKKPRIRALYDTYTIRRQEEEEEEEREEEVEQEEEREQEQEEDKEKKLKPVEDSSTSHLQIEFESIWSQYPKKISKKNAMEQYFKKRKKGLTYSSFQTGFINYMAYIELNKDWYTPAELFRWIRDDRYLDEYDLTPKKQQKYNKFNGKSQRKETVPAHFSDNVVETPVSKEREEYFKQQLKDLRSGRKSDE